MRAGTEVVTSLLSMFGTHALKDLEVTLNSIVLNWLACIRALHISSGIS